MREEVRLGVELLLCGETLLNFLFLQKNLIDFLPDVSASFPSRGRFRHGLIRIETDFVRRLDKVAALGSPTLEAIEFSRFDGTAFLGDDNDHLPDGGETMFVYVRFGST